MNTSTLHRYCAGEAVPQDFAPVERLAAFCEATPEERLELHRLWLLAVAARQRPRAAGEGAGAEPTVALAAQSPGQPSRPEEPVRPPAPPWFRRRRTLLGTAVGTVLLVTFGSLSALSADRSPGDSAKAPGQSTEPLASHRPSATATGPSPTGSSASPSAGVVAASANPTTKD